MTQEDIDNTFDDNSKDSLKNLMLLDKITLVLNNGVKFYKIVKKA